jgi:tRNA-dihydrouridine synthase
MKNFELFKPKSLLFAPLEGVTEEPYRIAMMKAFPEWDLFFTDFLRVPTVGRISPKHVLEHYGSRIYQNNDWKNKNSFQILTSPRAQTEAVVEIIEDLKIRHLDLNLGCPSNTVNSHFGGAFLLSKPKELEEILKKIRSRFSGTFTIKMRIGYKDDLLFLDNLKLIEDCGVEAITLHARTKEQLYKGIADWNYIKKAVETVNIPVIGNGDIWSVQDVDRIFRETNCYAIMCGRSAMKTPWLAHLFKENLKGNVNLDETFQLYERSKFIEIYFDTLLAEFREVGWGDFTILKRFKSLSRNLFDDYDNFETIRGSFLRSESLAEFLDHLHDL